MVTLQSSDYNVEDTMPVNVGSICYVQVIMGFSRGCELQDSPGSFLLIWVTLPKTGLARVYFFFFFFFGGGNYY